MEPYNPSELSNLVMILKLFNDQPHHLAVFLSENMAFTKEFRNKIKDSQTLSKLKKGGFTHENLHFNNIEDMKRYFDSLLDLNKL